MEEKKQQLLPPDEHRCCQTSGKRRYRCKNFRMSHGAAADDDDTVPKTKFCEKHYNYYKNRRKKKTSGVGEGAGSGPDLEMERKKKQLPPDEERCSYTWGLESKRYICKRFRMGYGADDDTVPKTKRCEKHYNYFTKYYQNLKKQKTSGDHTEEEDDYTSDTSAGGTSAKIVAKRKDVERIEGFGESQSLTGIREPVVESRAAKRMKMVMEGDLFIDETSNQPATDDIYDSADTIIEGGSDDNERKRKYAERMSGELESLTGSREPAVESESLENYKTKCIELSVELEKMELELEKQKVELEKKELELERQKVELEKKKVECTELQGKLAEVEETRKTAATDETERTPADATECLSYLESQVHRKENENSTMGCVESCILNLESQVLRMESENSTKEGCVESRISKLESQLLRMESKNSTTAGCVDSRISNSESLVPRMENGNLTMAGCVDSRISNLESLVLRSGKESSILRCAELRNSRRVEFEVRGLKNDITQSGEKPSDESNRGKLNAETSSEGRKDSHVYECKTKEKVLNVSDIGVNIQHESESELPKYYAMNISFGSPHLSSGGENIEEGKGRGSSSKRPSQHGLLSQDHLEMSKEPFANWFSDDNSGDSLGEFEDSDSSDGSKNSLGTLMDMLAMKYRNKNDNEEMKWKSEPDMVSSFEKDTELCMKAVCALYRQEISEDGISAKGLFFDSDALRATTLAKFLMDGACKGDLKKSVKEFEKFDSQGVEDCKRLARSYSKQLFSIYQSRKDPFFLNLLH